MAPSVMRLLGLLGAMTAVSTPVAAQLTLPLPIPILGGTVNCILCQTQAQVALLGLATGLLQGPVNGALEGLCNDATIGALVPRAQCISTADAVAGVAVNYVTGQISPQALCALAGQC